MAYEVKYVAQAPDYQVELLDYNEYSRPGTALSQVNGIVIHYTANPGTTAEQNRAIFENLKDTGETYASSHFVIGMDGRSCSAFRATRLLTRRMTGMKTR